MPLHPKVYKAFSFANAQGCSSILTLILNAIFFISTGTNVLGDIIFFWVGQGWRVVVIIVHLVWGYFIQVKVISQWGILVAPKAQPLKSGISSKMTEWYPDYMHYIF